MTPAGLAEIAAYLVVVLVLAAPLGVWIARVYEGERTFLDPLLGPLERLLYRVARVNPKAEMGWKEYTLAMLAFQFVGFSALIGLQLAQGFLPLNPARLGAVSIDSAVNTAISFVTNTNWQGYSGEVTMSPLTQMAGLAVQNFLSAATGIAILVALIRGLLRRQASTVGNFWVDLTRACLYILLPLSFVLAVALVSEGVVQSFSPPVEAALVDPALGGRNQTFSLGPVASQLAIKQLGTNGGGYFNANSAHPFENPTPLTNFLELLAILLLPAALCSTYGRMVRNRRQGAVLLAAMLVIFIPLTIAAYAAEQSGNPTLANLPVTQAPSIDSPGGNMEGKEARFGVASSALWAVATTAASNGSVNAMHDSFTPLGGLVPLWLIQLGEVVFGGVGSGLYGMILFALITVFVAGLMVGRTPEYLGKKIEAFEIKMAAAAVLAPCAAVLIGTAVAVATGAGRAGLLNPGAHGFSEALYAYSSAANNNGSAFAGISANNSFYNFSLALAMLVGRYLVAVPVLAIAGSLAAKKLVASSEGTLPTTGPLFVLLLVAVVVIVGALTFVPALALGPLAEHLALPRAG